AGLRNIICDAELRSPLLSKSRLATMNFQPLSSTANGNGDMFYVPSDDYLTKDGQKYKAVILITKMNKKHEIQEVLGLGPGVTLADSPPFQIEVNRVLFKCSEKLSAFVKTEYHNASNNLVYLVAAELSKEWWTVAADGTPLALLQRIICDS